MKKSGLADSPFFAPPPSPPAQPAPERKDAPPPATPASAPDNGKSAKQKKTSLLPDKHVAPPANREATTPRHREPMPPRYHATTVEAVRKAVKVFGKEAATHRFTAEEKKALADIIYAYKGQGIRTSENEVVRAAVNFVMADYRENGANSLLDRVLKALNA